MTSRGHLLGKRLKGRLRRRRPSVAAGAAAFVVLAVGVAAVGPDRAYGDASAPPDFPTTCPGATYPPAGYYNPTPGHPTPPLGYTGPAYHGPIPYEVPFKAIIYGGSITLGGTSPNVPSVLIPHLYASVCGTLSLPSLVGVVPSTAINLATPNIYVGTGNPSTSAFKGIEAIPASVTFGNLTTTLFPQPANNGGLDAQLTGDTTAAVNQLGMSCAITLNATFTTVQSGPLFGAPVTGPTQAGQARVVSNNFAVPKVVGSDAASGPDSLCPPAIAQAFNRVLGLPAASGAASFIAPFCFDFELEGVNNPAANQALNKDCPWPAH